MPGGVVLYARADAAQAMAMIAAMMRPNSLIRRMDSSRFV
jgi:hypothetical protein